MTPRALNESEIAHAVALGWLHPFKTDGPSDFGAHHVVTFFGKVFRLNCRRFSEVLQVAATEHDYEHWLGELCGLTREESNAKFQRALAEFPWLARRYRTAVDAGSKPGTVFPWRWRYGWRNDAACLELLKAQEVAA